VKNYQIDLNLSDNHNLLSLSKRQITNHFEEIEFEEKNEKFIFRK